MKTIHTLALLCISSTFCAYTMEENKAERYGMFELLITAQRGDDYFSNGWEEVYNALEKYEQAKLAGDFTFDLLYETIQNMGQAVEKSNEELILQPIINFYKAPKPTFRLIAVDKAQSSQVNAEDICSSYFIPSSTPLVLTQNAVYYKALQLSIKAWRILQDYKTENWNTMYQECLALKQKINSDNVTPDDLVTITKLLCTRSMESENTILGDGSILPTPDSGLIDYKKTLNSSER